MALAIAFPFVRALPPGKVTAGIATPFMVISPEAIVSPVVVAGATPAIFAL